MLKRRQKKPGSTTTSGVWNDRDVASLRTALNPLQNVRWRLAGFMRQDTSALLCAKKEEVFENTIGLVSGRAPCPVLPSVLSW